MKTRVLFGAAAALMLAACSQEEVLDIKQDGINYSVSAGKVSRAADSYCNNALPASFKVWANTGEGAMYINGDKIVRGDGNPASWTDQDGTRYWPENTTLDFFAEVNGDEVFDFNNGAPVFTDFTVKPLVKDQVDLMYAVKTDMAKTDAAVLLNFRHALSQVCFKARNTTKNMRVEIKGVSVGHLADNGSYTFPTESTDGNYENHSDEDAVSENRNTGVWSIPAAVAYDKQYETTFSTVTLEPGTDANLTCPGDGHAAGFLNVMTLLPQRVAAWQPETKGAQYNGAYFKVDVVLSNRVNTGTAEEPVYEYVAAYTGKAVIPVDIDWNEGCRYIYTFVFDEGGNGGWTDDPADPKPVLTTIKYDLTIDDFVPVSEGDTGMDTGEQASYRYSATLKLHSDEEAGAQVKTIAINSNESPYSFTLAGEYTPAAPQGKKFNGWSDGTNTYAEGSTISIDFSKSVVDLYALWADVTYNFTINFDTNGGVDTEGFVASTSVNRVDGFQYTVSNSYVSREGYEFVGWGLTKDATEAVETITLDKNNPEVTLYAVWKAKTSSGDYPGEEY